jgi:hypothetical protein
MLTPLGDVGASFAVARLTSPVHARFDRHGLTD